MPSMPPIPGGGPAGPAGASSLTSLIKASVVKTIAATLEEFSIAALVTFAGSMIPRSRRLVNSPVSASYPTFSSLFSLSDKITSPETPVLEHISLSGSARASHKILTPVFSSPVTSIASKVFRARNFSF